MGKTRFGMTMSLDGFVADRSGDVGSLYPDFAALRHTEALDEARRRRERVLVCAERGERDQPRDEDAEAEGGDGACAVAVGQRAADGRDQHARRRPRREQDPRLVGGRRSTCWK